MKKLIISILLSLIFIFSFSSVVLGDVILPGFHYTQQCTKFVNLDKFPNIVLIGYVTGPMIEKSVTQEIKNNECLDAGYQYDSLDIYWNTKNKPTTIDPHKLLVKNIVWYGGGIDKDNPLIKTETEYSIAGFLNKKLVVYKSKEISTYNDGTPKKVEVFPNPLDNKKLKNKDKQFSSDSRPKNFWQVFWRFILCFLKGLFGKGC